MKLLFDQNLSPRLVKKFEEFFNDSIHVQNLKLDTSSDKVLWEYAKVNEFTIVTKDTDFNNMVSLYGFPPKIIWIRRGNVSTQLIQEILTEHIEIIINFIIDTKNGILTLN